MLLNRSCCSPSWPQEGIYLSSNSDMGNLFGWSTPVKMLNAYGWYPQILGEDPGGTDKVAGSVSRLYIGGYSWAEMVVTPDPPPTSPDNEPELKRHSR